MASNTTNLGLRKPATTDNWSVQDDFNANMDKIDAYVGKHNLGSFATLSALEDALNSLGATMQRGDSLDIYFTMSAATGLFSATGYIGRIMKVLDAVRYRVILYANGSNIEIDGVQWGGSTWSWAQHVPTYIAGTWTPKLYDYETYKRDLAAQPYYKIGNFYVMFLYQQNIDYSGITTMVQYRNLPCAHCIGGTIYLQGKKGSIAKDIGAYIQGSGRNAYARENIVSTDFANPTSSGVTNLVLFGYD